MYCRPYTTPNAPEVLQAVADVLFDHGLFVYRYTGWDEHESQWDEHDSDRDEHDSDMDGSAAAAAGGGSGNASGGSGTEEGSGQVGLR